MKAPYQDRDKMNKMDKTDWQKKGIGHRQRLRDKFLRYGISAFTEAEILELLLALGTPRQDCKDRAKEALKHFGGLSSVLEATVAQLKEVPGIGDKNAFAVKFIHEVARAFLKDRLREKTYVNAARDVVEYLWHSLSLRKQEVFIVVFLDAKHGILNVEEIFEGTLTQSAVYPREVIKKAIEYHAAALVLAHNHPSGMTRPSGEDKAITRRLYMAAGLFDIRILDHIIIGETGRYFSFTEEGLMEEIKRQIPPNITESDEI
jgi:DNA repair protein RadC